MTRAGEHVFVNTGAWIALAIVRRMATKRPTPTIAYFRQLLAA